MLLKYNKQKRVLVVSHSHNDSCDLNDPAKIAMYMDKNRITNAVLIFDYAVSYKYITLLVTILRAKVLAIGSKRNGKLVWHWTKENLSDETLKRVFSLGKD